MEELRKIANSFIIRASATNEILFDVGLTEKQNKELEELQKRDKGDGKPLTENQKVKLQELIAKRDAKPQLTQGAKTHCKKWLKNKLYGRREEIKSKYIYKGNKSEEDGFTLMALYVIKDMVYKNTERKSNEWLEGECDLFHNKIVYDNKCSWSLETFPMYDDEATNEDYIKQLNSYSWLWDAEKAILCYTLIDTPDELVEQAIRWENDVDKRYKIVERMIYTNDNFERLKSIHFASSTLDTFKEIPEEDRIISFEIDIDLTMRDKLKRNVELCREYIYELLIKKHNRKNGKNLDKN